ncbi:sensor histidine kinase [Radiobacillus sp. PE A8.2]|uniref:sensor histidine kinase n=1 Tax=Radiobacillus sp. PE A8.2 TaxID=3380349 RepID=UPI00388FCD56
MSKFRSTIFLKLFGTFIGTMFFSFILLSTIAFILFRNDIENRHNKLTIEQITSIQELLDQAYLEGWSQELVKSTINLSLSGNNATYFLYDNSGELLYKAGVQTDLVIEKSVVEDVLSGKAIDHIQRMENDPRVLIMGAPLTGNYQEHAIILTTLEAYYNINAAKKLFLYSLIPTTLIIAVMLFFLSKKITVPVKNMSEIAKNIAEGNFKSRVKVKSNDEIGRLGETFNFMADELEGLEKMRRDFIANVSHDLRTPLTSVHGFLTAIIDGTIPKEKEKHYLKIMKEQTEREIKLVNDLLALSKLEANKLEINRENYNLSEELRKIIARMDLELTKKQVEVQLNTDEDKDIWVYADPDKIDQVVTNLIRNAIQFSTDKSNIEVSLTTRDNNAVFTVRDYGPGIDKENIKNIWQRFYKEDKARSQKVGTGIGLSIVKEIIELHQTTIEVESSPSQGTKFTFTLPLKK